MRSRLRSQSGTADNRASRSLELVRVRGTQRGTGHEGRPVSRGSRRRGGRGRGRYKRPAPQKRQSFWGWLKGLFGGGSAPRKRTQRSTTDQEAKALSAFQRHYGVRFERIELLKLALTHRSYLSVSGQGPRESNERLEFLGDSVLGLVTSEFLYRENPAEHEGQLTKSKSLLVSKAILSRRALAMGLGRFVLMSHSEVESGGRQRLSIIADAFESVVGAIYLDQGFEAARQFITHWLLREADEITADKRHTNYKSHLQEYVQSTFHTHPVYRIRGEVGPDHSKYFHVEVMVGKRVLGEGRGRNKKEAEQSAARNAIEKIQSGRTRGKRGRDERSGNGARARRSQTAEVPAEPELGLVEGTAPTETSRRPRRPRRESMAGRDASEGETRESPAVPAMPELSPPDVRSELEPRPSAYEEDDLEEVGRPEGPHEDRRVDPYGFGTHDEMRADGAAADTDPSTEWRPEERPDEHPESRSEPQPKGPSAPRYGRRRGRGRR